MGREVRRVPPNWEHPKSHNDNYQPLYDSDGEQDWLDYLCAWDNWVNGGGFESAVSGGFDGTRTYRSFCDWHGTPPNQKYHRPSWNPDDATWFQVYETVTEGTPVSPSFATREELVEYLVQHGDFADQMCNRGGWSRSSAESFVKSGWVPSMAIIGGKVVAARDVANALESDRSETQ